MMSRMGGDKIGVRGGVVLKGLQYKDKSRSGGNGGGKAGDGLGSRGKMVWLGEEGMEMETMGRMMSDNGGSKRNCF